MHDLCDLSAVNLMDDHYWCVLLTHTHRLKEGHIETVYEDLSLKYDLNKLTSRPVDIIHVNKNVIGRISCSSFNSERDSVYVSLFFLNSWPLKV